MNTYSIEFSFYLLFIAISSFTCPYSYSGMDPFSPPQGQINFNRIEASTVFFSAPAGEPPPLPLKTELFDLSYVGTIRPKDGGDPYFLLAGKPCQNCLDERGIFAVRPSGGKPTALGYPGKIVDPKTHALLVESRAFFGKCLPNRDEMYLVFQKERVDRRSQLQSSIFIAEASKEHLNETLLERNLPPIKTVLKRKKTCQEIAGRNRLVLKKPLDLRPQSNMEGDDTEDDLKKVDNL